MPVILHRMPDSIECMTDSDSHTPDNVCYPLSETLKCLYIVIYRLAKATLTVQLILIIIHRLMFVIHVVILKVIESSQYIQATIY